MPKKILMSGDIKLRRPDEIKLPPTKQLHPRAAVQRIMLTDVPLRGYPTPPPPEPQAPEKTQDVILDAPVEIPEQPVPGLHIEAGDPQPEPEKRRPGRPLKK